MKIEPTRILDRELSLAISEELRQHASPVVREIIDEGIRVFERCSATAPGRDENIGLLYPYLQLIEILDGVEIALSGASTTAATILLRAAFEALLAVEWVCKDGSLRYGAAAVVTEIHRRISSTSRFIRNDPRRKEFLQVLKADAAGKHVRIPLLDDASTTVAGLKRLLSEPHLKDAATEYARTTGTLRKPPFYALWGGPRTLQQLAQKLDRGGQYEVLYRTWSRTVHAVDVERQLGAVDNQAAVRPFRSGGDLQQSYAFAIQFGLEGIRAILGHYRPDELNTSYRRWYSTEIRDVYQRLGPKPPN